MKVVVISSVFLVCVSIGGAQPDPGVSEPEAAAKTSGGSGVAPTSCVIRIAFDSATVNLDVTSTSRLLCTLGERVYERFAAEQAGSVQIHSP